MHIHTTVSDGKATPEEAKEAYKSRGYSIVAYTDHSVMVPHNELAARGRYIRQTETRYATRRLTFATLSRKTKRLKKDIRSTAKKYRTYIRLTVKDKNGDRAYTRAYFLDELI